MRRCNDKLAILFSFVGKNGFLGACYVQQMDEQKLSYPSFAVRGLPTEQVEEIAVVLVPANKVPKDHKWHNRLLTREEVAESSGGAVRYEDA